MKNHSHTKGEPVRMAAAQSVPAVEGEKIEVVAYMAGIYRTMIEQNRIPLGAEVSFINPGWFGQIELMDVAQHERLMTAQQRTQAAGVPDGVEWIACSERLPEHGGPVAVWCSGSESPGVAWMRQGAWYMPEPQAIGYDTITHWAPFPPAPAQPAVQGEVQGRWIPVSERLPSVAQEVIVNSEFDGVTAGFLDSYGEWYSPNSDYKLTRVVAWQPLPAAPALAASTGQEVES